jgi:hypothetical protein
VDWPHRLPADGQDRRSVSGPIAVRRSIEWWTSRQQTIT